MPLLRFIKACNWWNSDRMGTSSLIIQCSLCLQSNYSIQNGVTFWKSSKESQYFSRPLLLTVHAVLCASKTIHFISPYWVTQHRCCLPKWRNTLDLNMWFDKILYWKKQILRVHQYSLWHSILWMQSFPSKIQIFVLLNCNIYIFFNMYPSVCLVLQNGGL